MEQATKEIIIGSDSRVIDVQNAFSFYYPFLKIEFSKKDRHSLASKNHKVNPNALMSQISELMSPITIDVEEKRTVAEVENDFHTLLGLSAKLFRKSGKVWNVISLTDSWTLESQNKAGEFISTEMSTTS